MLFLSAAMDRNGIFDKWTNWELWPFSLRYLAISPAWLWFSFRARSFWFFTPSNPTITFGGFEGEGKKEMYDQLPQEFVPKTIYAFPHQSFEEIQQQLAENGFTYPFCVKPEVGMKGLLFRKIDKEEHLRIYHAAIPFCYIIQELVDYPIEVSVFYYRFPHQQKGVITGFIKKELMEVVGDGAKTVIQLIQEHPNARHREEEMRMKHADHLQRVLVDGEKYQLTHAANLSRGAKFVNLNHLIDDKLTCIFDRLSHHTNFFYGRYDIKCHSIEDLWNGANFLILEFNGSGAEPNHVYNAGYSLREAQKEFLKHWGILYKISKHNHQQGIHYWPFLKGLKFLRSAKKHLQLLEEYDSKIIF